MLNESEAALLLRMLMHSAVFTVAIAFGAMAMNGAGMLDGYKTGKTRGYSSYDSRDSAFWLKKDDHEWKRKEHDDD
jgi:hypothetical protein